MGRQPGTVFAVNTNGTGYTNLHNLTAASGSFLQITNCQNLGPPHRRAPSLTCRIFEILDFPGKFASFGFHQNAL